ncbi:MAG: hypothetical protein ACYDG3_11140 [Bacillati bacterium]
MSEEPQRDVGDEVIDQYIEELKKTKTDPKKKKEFIEKFNQQASHSPEDNSSNSDNGSESQPEEDPLMRATVPKTLHSRRLESSTNDDGIGLISQEDRSEARSKPEPEPKRRVIPSGEYKEKQLSEEERAEIEQSDESVGIDVTEPQDDVTRLENILKESKIKSAPYVLKNYVKRSYPTTRRAAEYLNRLLIDISVNPKIRRVVIRTFYDNLSDKAIDSIFRAEEEDDDEDGESANVKRPTDGKQLVKIPLRDKSGKPILDAEGHVILKEVTKDDLYYAVQMSQMSGGSGDYMDVILKLQDDRHREGMEFMKQQTAFWQRAASGDPVKRLVEQKKELMELGIVGDTEKPSDYQTKVIQEARAAGKEVFQETKGEIKTLIELFRDDIIKPALKNSKSHEGPREIEDFKNEKDQEDAFSILSEAVNQEAKKLTKEDNQ